MLNLVRLWAVIKLILKCNNKIQLKYIYVLFMHDYTLLTSPVLPGNGISAAWWWGTLTSPLRQECVRWSGISFTAETDSFDIQALWHPLRVNRKIWPIASVLSRKTSSFEAVVRFLSRSLFLRSENVCTTVFCDVFWLGGVLRLSWPCWPEKWKKIYISWQKNNSTCT